MKARESGKALRWEEVLGFRKGQRANTLQELREWGKENSKCSEIMVYLQGVRKGGHLTPVKVKEVKEKRAFRLEMSRNAPGKQIRG